LLTGCIDAVAAEGTVEPKNASNPPLLLLDNWGFAGAAPCGIPNAGIVPPIAPKFAKFGIPPFIAGITGGDAIAVLVANGDAAANAAAVALFITG